MRLYYSIYNIMATSKSTKKRKKNIRIKTRKAQKGGGGRKKRFELTNYPTRGLDDAVSENKFNNTFNNKPKAKEAWPESGTEDKFSDVIPLLKPDEVRQLLYEVQNGITEMFTDEITKEITDKIQIATSNLGIIKANNNNNNYTNEVENLLTMLENLKKASVDNIEAKKAVDAALISKKNEDNEIATELLKKATISAENLLNETKNKAKRVGVNILLKSLEEEAKKLEKERKEKAAEEEKKRVAAEEEKEKEKLAEAERKAKEAKDKQRVAERKEAKRKARLEEAARLASVAERKAKDAEKQRVADIRNQYAIKERAKAAKAATDIQKIARQKAAKAKAAALANKAAEKAAELAEKAAELAEAEKQAKVEKLAEEEKLAEARVAEEEKLAEEKLAEEKKAKEAAEEAKELNYYLAEAEEKPAEKLKELNTMVSGQLDAVNDINIIQEIQTAMGKESEYTPEMAKNIAATSDIFIKLLEKAMNDAVAHKILWEKITPKGIDTSRIKTLTIKDIIKSANFIKTNTIMTEKETGQQLNIPIILGIPNNSNRDTRILTKIIGPDLANLCGYLLDYVFSGKREGEEFTLLAMYVAININNDCFNNYILNIKKKNADRNTCNTAFNNIAGILGIDLLTHDATFCKAHLIKAANKVYGVNWKTKFKDVIESGSDNDINEKLKELAINEKLKELVLTEAAAKLRQVQTKFGEITYNYNNNNLPDGVYNNIYTLQRYIDVIEMLKKKDNYEVEVENNKESINNYINNVVNATLPSIK